MKKNITLDEYIVKANFNELYTEFYSNFKITNKSKEVLELLLSIPLAKNTVIKGFEAKIGSTIVSSKIFALEKGKEKFSDSVAQGNKAFLASLSDKTKVVDVTLGNLEPLDQVEIKLFTLQLNYTKDKSICFSYDPALLPKISGISINNKLDRKLGIQFEATFNSNSNNQINNINSDDDFSSTSNSKARLTRLICPNYTSKQTMTIAKDLSSATLTIFINKHSSNSNLNIVEVLFRTTETIINKFIEEYDPTLKLYTYNVNFMFDNYNNIKNPLDTSNINSALVDSDATKSYKQCYDEGIINDFPANFTFIIDQSGSMSGNKIQIARESLILFLKSLPQGSKFDIYGFGTGFRFYTDKEGNYNEEYLSQTIETVNELQANLGGTELNRPLSDYYSNLESKKSNFDNNKPKFIFILTDGVTINDKLCLDLVSKNSDNTKVFSFGIGRDIDKSFIEKIATLGHGSHYYISNTENLKEIIISALNLALKPYMSNVKLEFSNNNDKDIILQYPDISNSVICQDELFSYSFISKNRLDENTNIKLSYNDNSLGETINKEFMLKDNLTSIQGNSLNKLVAGLKLNSKINSDENKNEEEKKELTDLAIKFQVLTPFTSLFAEVESISQIVNQTNNVKLELNENKLEKNKIYDLNPFHQDISDSESFRGSNVKLSKKCLLRSKAMTKSKVKVSTNMPSGRGGRGLLLCKMKYSSRSRSVSEDEESNSLEGFNSSNDRCRGTPKETLCLNNINLKSLKEETLEEKVYKEIIQNQSMNGLWKKSCSNTSDMTRYFNTKNYNISLIEITRVLNTKNPNTNAFNGFNLDDLAFTILILLILSKEFSSKQKEHMLIYNKSVKALSKANLNFRDFENIVLN